MTGVLGANPWLVGLLVLVVIGAAAHAGALKLRRTARTIIETVDDIESDGNEP